MARDGSLSLAERIIIPLDFSRPEEAFGVVEMLVSSGCWFKLGLEAITASLNPDVPIVANCIKLIKREGGRIFFDGKFCDIPNTVGAAAANAAALGGVDAFNMHAWSGRKAMLKAVANRGQAEVWVVTLLTSLGYEDLADLGFFGMPSNMMTGYAKEGKLQYLVRRMAVVAKECGCQGIICSPRELPALQDISLTKITPGVRPEWASQDDQKRIMTPREAIAKGADFLVIGRPITSPPPTMGGPKEAFNRVLDEILLGLEERPLGKVGA